MLLRPAAARRLRRAAERHRARRANPGPRATPFAGELGDHQGGEGVPAWSKCSLGSAPARLLFVLRALLAALGGSVLPGRGRPSGRSAQPLPRVLELAASQAAYFTAYFTAFDHSGVLRLREAGADRAHAGQVCGGTLWWRGRGDGACGSGRLRHLRSIESVHVHVHAGRSGCHVIPSLKHWDSRPHTRHHTRLTMPKSAPRAAVPCEPQHQEGAAEERFGACEL